MTTDTSSTFDSNDMRRVVGYDMTANAAKQVYEAASIGPEDLDVFELHDCFTANELITDEGLGLTPEGTAEKFILDGDNTYGGRIVTNRLGRPAVQGAPARRHRVGAVLRAGLAAARHSRPAPGRRRTFGPAAQPGLGRCLCGHALPKCVNMKPPRSSFRVEAALQGGEP